MKHRQGGKISGRHTSVTDDAALVVDAVSKLSTVSRIVLAGIQRKKASKRLGFKDVDAGVRISVCSPASIQIIYVYATDREAVKQTAKGVMG